MLTLRELLLHMLPGKYFIMRTIMVIMTSSHREHSLMFLLQTDIVTRVPSWFEYEYVSLLFPTRLTTNL